ncbi:deoxyribonuclease IV [Kitasatospora purpeofusca]|uniref:deoxyribonuclease IV n=1 Tax=Kitasatospora purpeofusca TaxID=67352 RepID=UPI00225AD7C6|nr:deoxyribonuclease IV [Kitasatospora purpeofusca]MCX4756322.1 deoxyribonuclease IV [Kitasatospora purpeofusca]WSR35851.1 deoxyribonuclease IV [Kitasatospora purpeofusca]WSR44160.1 deoxyribonuclease IV [Kitasatospora purpeofusca]
MSTSTAEAAETAAETAAGLRNPIGAHVPVAGRGLAGTGLAYAGRVGAETVQVFVANPRGWATPTGNPAQDAEFRAACAERAVPAYVHAPYLINFGSDNPVTRERSADSLRHSLRRGHAIGALGVVLHTGSAVGSAPGGGSRRAEAMSQVREDVRRLLDELDGLGEDAPWLLLEPTAGQGSSLCARMEDLAGYMEALDGHPKVGVCLDTCHAFAAGHDLAAPGGVRATLDALVEAAGPGRLRLIHANDSEDAVGARKDRHANIGAGLIGAEPFRELFEHPATAGVPLVVETPDRKHGGEGAGHTLDITALKRLRSRAASALPV